MKLRKHLNFVAALFLWAAIAATGPLQAQETSTPDEDQIFELDAFEVTGFAASQTAAIVRKRLEPVIVEAVVAEDIGKLPDTSIAETLSRLPGITSQRVNGRSQELSIRGLSGDFTTALLNGREQVSTGSHRSVEFDQFPAELLSGAIVYKTGDASLVNQGIAGTVDLRTVRPLSQGRRVFAANAFYEWTQLDALNAGSEESGWRISSSYIDQFNDDTFGLAIGAALMSKPGQGEQWNAWGYPNVSSSLDSSEPFVLGGAKPFVRSSELERNGYMAVLEFKPSRTFSATVDLYYTDFEETQLLRGIEIPLWWSSAQLQPGFRVEDGLVMEGTFGNVFGVVRNDIVFRDANMYSAGVNLEFGDVINDAWFTVADLSYSRVDRVDTVLETYSGTGSNQSGPPDTMRYSLEGGTGAKFTPAIDYTNPSNLVLTGPQGWGGDVVPGGQLGYLKEPETQDELTQIKVETTRRFDRLFGFMDNAKGGFNFTRRTKFEEEAGKYIAGKNGATELPFPESTGVTDLSFIGIPGMASYDPLAALDSGIYDLIVNPNADVQSADWNVEEEISTFYLQADILGEIGSIVVTGNVGFQAVYSDQFTTGTAASGGGDSVLAIPVEGEHDYWDFVPSLNLNFELDQNQMVRFSAARQMARQRMNDMRAGNQYGFNATLIDSLDPFNSPWSGSGGNPELEPWRANSVDLSYEYYLPENKGVVALTGFYKYLVSYTYDEPQLVDFTGYPFDGTEEPAIRQGTLTIPQNGSGGEIKGVELSVSITGDVLSDYLNGFGLVASGAYTESTISPDQNNDSIAIPGLSERVASVTLYYEKYGFSARGSMRYRSDYRANISTFGPRGENFRTIAAETVVDAQISYAFAETSPLSGFTILLQGYNLTDEPLASYENEDTRLVRDYQRYGRSYSVGVSYKY